MTDDIYAALDSAVDAVVPPVETNLLVLMERAYQNSKAHGFHDHGEALDAQLRIAEAKADLAPSPEVAQEVLFWRRVLAEHHGNRLMLLAGEVAEAHEEVRHGHALTEVYFSTDEQGRPKPEGVPIELADAAIRLFDTARSRGIDLAAAISMKMAYNEGRPAMHGGKVM